MSKKVKIFAIVVVSLAVVIGAISFFGGSSSAPAAIKTALPGGSGLSSTPNAAMPLSNASPLGMPGAVTSGAGGNFGVLLSSVKSITIDTSIFSNPAYKTLRDHPITLGTDVVGRQNPFAPVGNDGGSDSVSTTPIIQTLQPDKVTSTSAEFGAQLTLQTTTSAQVVFQYGTSDTFGSATAPLTLTKTGTALTTVTDLLPSTTYYVQAVVVQGSSTVNGNTMTFTTTTPVPKGQ